MHAYKNISISKYSLTNYANVKGLDVKTILLRTCLKDFTFQICP